VQDREPALASYLHSSVIGHASIESSLAFILANKLSSPAMLSTNLMQMMLKAYTINPVCSRPSLGVLTVQ
jgi:serine O-acetyltransferase